MSALRKNAIAIFILGFAVGGITSAFTIMAGVSPENAIVAFTLVSVGGMIYAADVHSQAENRGLLKSERELLDIAGKYRENAERIGDLLRKIGEIDEDESPNLPE